MIKVAIVGYGLSATVFHIPFVNYANQFSLMAISSSRTKEVQDAHPDVDVYESAQHMIEQSDAELVIITSPNNTHYELAELALACNKHVLLEKPMTSTSEQALALAKIAFDKSLILSVYHNRRWDGDYLTLQQIIKSGQLGKIKVLNSHFDRFRPNVRDRWREQAGVATGIWYDLGSHLVDQALNLFGAPQALTANCTMLRENATSVDYFQVMLHYTNMEVVLQSSPFSADPNIRFQLQGTKGSYIKYALDPQEDQLREGVTPLMPGFGIEPPANYGKKYLVDVASDTNTVTKIETMKGCYYEFYSQLALAINSGLKVPVTALEGAKVIKIIELAMQSSATGQRVAVDLSSFHAEQVFS